jgi:hypothetical protein
MRRRLWGFFCILHSIATDLPSSTLNVCPFNSIIGTEKKINERRVISWREQIQVRWDDDAHFAIDKHDQLDFYCATNNSSEPASLVFTP